MLEFDALIDINYYHVSLFHNKLVSKVYENLIDLYQNNTNNNVDFNLIFTELTNLFGDIIDI